MSVAAADACARVGLTVPPFPSDIAEKLSIALPPVGNSIRNPVDVGAPVVAPKAFLQVLEAAASAPNIDVVIATQTIHLFMSAKMGSLAHVVASLVDESREAAVTVARQYGKPVVMVLPVGSTETDSLDIEKARREFRDFYVEHGIPVYPTLERAARAVAHVVHYYQWRANGRMSDSPATDTEEVPE